MKKLILLFAILFATTSFSQEVFTTKVKMKQTPNLSVPDSIVTKDGSQILRTTSVADFSALIAQPTPSLQDVTTVGATTTTTIQSIGFHAVPSSGIHGSFLLPENLRVFDNANDFLDLSMVLTYPTAIFGKDGFESSLSTIDLTADRNINLPNNNGTLVLDADLLNYVTLATDQIITGNKTIQGNQPLILKRTGGLDSDNVVEVKNGVSQTKFAITGEGQVEAVSYSFKDIIGETVFSGDILYLSTDGKYYIADANSESTSSTELVVASTAGVLDDTIKLFVSGNLSGFSGLTTGKRYYIDEGGGITTDRSGFISGSISRYIGTAKGVSVLKFNPSSTYIEIF